MKVIYDNSTEPYYKYHKDNVYNYYIWLNSDNIECYRFIRIPRDTNRYMKLTNTEIYDLGGEFSNSCFIYKE